MTVLQLHKSSNAIIHIIKGGKGALLFKLLFRDILDKVDVDGVAGGLAGQRGRAIQGGRESRVAGYLDLNSPGILPE